MVEIKIEVTFHIDSEGILNLTARDIDTGQLVESRLKLGKEGGSRRRRRRQSTRTPDSAPSRPSQPSQPSQSSPASPPRSLNMPQSSLAAPKGQLSCDRTVPACAQHRAAAGHAPQRPRRRGPPGRRTAPHRSGATVAPRSVPGQPSPNHGTVSYEPDEHELHPPERKERGFFEWLLALFGLVD